MQYNHVIVPKRGQAPRIAQAEVRDPAPGEIRVRVEAAGLAFGDLLLRDGHAHPGAKLPEGLGFDLTGRIDALGDGVVGFTVGQRVTTMPIENGITEVAYLSPSKLVVVPSHLDPVSIAAMTFNYLTAYQMRRAAGMGVDSMLIHSAAGGIGTAMLQLTRLDGLTVFGTASVGKHDVVRRYGGIPIDYKSEDFVKRILSETRGEGVATAFDAFGGRYLWRTYRTVRRDGRLVCYGITTAIKYPINLPISLGILGIAAVRKSARLFSTSGDEFQNRADLSILLKMLELRQIEPLIGAVLPMSETARALTMIELGETTGKIVITM
jgi:NADPH:quinone reductase-like Zn-dependent oxidoreductase